LSKSNKLRRKAQSLLKKGKYDKAVEVYNKLLSSHKNNPNLNNELGDIYLKAGDRIMAVSSFEKAAAHYEQVALYNNAVAVCKKILRIVPDRTITVYKLGELKAKQNFLPEAEKHFLTYLDTILAEIDSPVEGSSDRVEAILEMMKDFQSVKSKAVDVLSALGLKYRAAEVNAQLIRDLGEGNAPELMQAYRERMESLLSSLSAEEIGKIKDILGSSVEGQDQKAASPEDEMSVSDMVSETVAGSEEEVPDQADSPCPAGRDEEVLKEDGGESSEDDGKAPEQVVEREGVSFEQEKGVRPESEEVYTIPVHKDEPGKGDAEEAPGEPAAGERESEAVMSGESQEPAAGERKSEADEEERGLERGVREEPFPPPELDSQEAPEALDDSERDWKSGLTGESAGDSKGDGRKGGFEDLSDITGETAQSDSPAGSITSDVEKDDFKSHYDLGMAYIEMALYDEAVRELQISSRSDQFRLQSLEMIGLCFISKGSPRLAVKQLERGLDIARDAGKESLGIHYNLGMAYEALGEDKKALEHFEEVYIVDVTFREIQEKMKKLKTHV